MALTTFILICYFRRANVRVHGQCQDRVSVKVKFKVKVSVTFKSFKIEVKEKELWSR